MYEGCVRLDLAHAFVAATNNLSEANTVRFEAKMCLVAALVSFSRGPNGPSHEHLIQAENVINGLMEMLNEKAGDFARSIERNSTPTQIEWNRARHSSRLHSFRNGAAGV